MYTTTKDYLTNLQQGLSSDLRRETDLRGIGIISREELQFLLELFLDFLRIYSTDPSLEYNGKEQGFFKNCALEYENVNGSKLAAWKLFSPMMSINEKRVNPSKQLALRMLAMEVIKATDAKTGVTAGDKMDAFFGMREYKQYGILVSSLDEVLYRF